jgi:hypothetical protein
LIKEHIKELRRLYGKFREGNLTTLEALNGHLFFYEGLLIFVIPLFSGYFIDTESEWFEDKRVYFLWAVLFILLFIKWMFLFSRTLPKRPSVLIKIYRTLGSIFIAALLSFICTPYFSFWNAVSGSGEKILIGGPIIHMKVETASRYYGKPRRITILHNGRNITLTVPPEEYENLSLGQTYSREMRLGGLGYYYNWGSSWWK